MSAPWRQFRALRLLLPLVALSAALALFLGIGLIISWQGFGGGSGGGPCDASLGPMGATAAGGVDDATGGTATAAARLTEEQQRNAATIIGVAKGMDLPPRAWMVALATAMQESRLRNINYGDRDSLGLFQQRPSQGWGSPAQVTDPVYATTIFLRKLTAIPGWDQLPLTTAAQAVQRSAFPDAYARWEGLAAWLVQTLADVADPMGCGSGAATLPGGLVRTAIEFALGQVGKPYVWGATGPDSFDCSGLMLRAFQAAGIYLPRVAREQYKAGGHVPLAQAQPGDLLFLATDPHDPATIHHVMLYLGNGTIAEAPYTGVPVRTQKLDVDNRELVPLATRPGTAPNPA